MTAIDILKTGTHSHDCCFHQNGEIHDPVIGAPFQYGTPYYTACNAVLALKTTGAETAGDHRRKSEELLVNMALIISARSKACDSRAPNHFWVNGAIEDSDLPDLIGLVAPRALSWSIPSTPC